MTDDTDLLMRAQTAEALLLDEERKNEALMVRIEELEARLRAVDEKKEAVLQPYQKAVLEAVKQIPVRKSDPVADSAYYYEKGVVASARLDVADYELMLRMIQGEHKEQIPAVRIEQDMSTGDNFAVITDGAKYYRLRLDMRRIHDTRTMEDVERLFTDYAHQALRGLGSTKKNKKLADALGEQIALAVGRSSGVLRGHFSRIANRW